MSRSQVYGNFQNLIGADKFRKLLAGEYLKCQKGQKMLDVGCGPAEILSFLPEVDYLGVDLNADYIKKARQKFGFRANFICEDITKEAVLPKNHFDVALAIGLLHHLSDEQVIGLFKSVHAALKPKARFITFDGTYAEGQSAMAKFLLSKDRGEFVRKDKEYIRLAEQVFQKINSSVRHDQLRIPYSFLIMELEK